MEKLFKLKENQTKVSTEILAGITTFVTMAYIIMVNPAILSESGMEWGAVFLATIISAVVGTLIMGLFANIPYAQAPGMGLNAFFVYTVCFGLGFTWQQALSMVFVCGILNIIVTVTRVRTALIRAIPKSLQYAISGGIGLFIAYIGFLNVGFIEFGAVPGLATLNSPTLWLFLIGLVILVALMTLKVRGGILIGIVATTLIGWIFFKDMRPSGEGTVSFLDSAKSLKTTFGVIFTSKGLPTLVKASTAVVGGNGVVITEAHSAARNVVVALVTIFAFSLTDMFDTIGCFIGTGRRSGIFTKKEEQLMENSHGLKSKMERGLFADMVATTVGAVIGTSNVTTYVESTAGIAVGGRTGLTSVVTAVLLALSAFAAPFVSAIPGAATAPALVIVGVLMVSSFADIRWTDVEEAIPALFAGAFMAFSYSITTGIAFGFIFHCIVKIAKRKTSELHPILIAATLLFILNFILQAVV
ncbi:MAG: NCS2 family permease [Oscillospiraceae bacterium]|nr:NCS2 family permease [Oscillospiraceae bacterium]